VPAAAYEQICRLKLRHLQPRYRSPDANPGCPCGFFDVAPYVVIRTIATAEA
jgi:hypothetical protein